MFSPLAAPCECPGACSFSVAWNTDLLNERGVSCVFSTQGKHLPRSRHHLMCCNFTSYLIFMVTLTSERTPCSLCTENITPSSPSLCLKGQFQELPVTKAGVTLVFNSIGISEAGPMLSQSNAAVSQALALLLCHLMSWLDFALSCFNYKARVGWEHVFISVL